MRSNRAEEAPIPAISVEHVMPQEWTENYPLVGEMVPKEMNNYWFFGGTDEEKQRYERLRPLIQQRRELIHCVGNLTVVTQPLNAAMRNARFDQKKDYFRESVLALNRYFDPITEWNEHAIQERADNLFRHASTIWVGPIAT